MQDPYSQEEALKVRHVSGTTDSSSFSIFDSWSISYSSECQALSAHLLGLFHLTHLLLASFISSSPSSLSSPPQPIQERYQQHYLSDPLFAKPTISSSEALRILEPPPVRHLVNIHGINLHTEKAYFYERGSDGQLRLDVNCKRHVKGSLNFKDCRVDLRCPLPSQFDPV